MNADKGNKMDMTDEEIFKQIKAYQLWKKTGGKEGCDFTKEFRDWLDSDPTEEEWEGFEINGMFL